jgi:hypothetical protein
MAVYRVCQLGVRAPLTLLVADCPSCWDNAAELSFLRIVFPDGSVNAEKVLIAWRRAHTDTVVHRLVRREA